MFVEEISQWGEASFAPPAPGSALRECEARLGEPLPLELHALLAETNGVRGEFELGLVWDVERIAAENVRCRSDPSMLELYLPFEGLVFFGDAGNGDQFAVSQRALREVYVWNHEDDSRRWVAPSVLRYLEWWMKGAITL